MALNIKAIFSLTTKGVDQAALKAKNSIDSIGRASKRTANISARAFAKTGASLQKLGGGVQRLGGAFTSAGSVFAAAAIPAAGLALVIGKSVTEFARFEKQMSVVKSLTSELTKDTEKSKDQFKAMNAEAKRLGATTAFTATQAAEGFQFLALAGFNVQDQIASLPQVLNLAAAGSLDLKSASDIVTDSMSALLPALDKNDTKVQKITDLTDKFAFIQSKTNTNVLQLGEAIKLGGGAMAAAKIPLNDILVSMGALANAGLKGSIGGTALVNMMNKLAKPTSKGSKLLDRLGIKTKDAGGNFLSLPKLIGSVVEGMKQLEGGADRAAVAQEIFGVRGQRAINALMNVGVRDIELLQKGIENATGAAAKQAEIRLDNLAGSFTKMQSAITGVLIEVGSGFGTFFTKPIKNAAKQVADLAVAFQVASGEIELSKKAFGIKKDKEIPKRIIALIEFAKGFKEGFNEILVTANNVFDKIISFLKDTFGEGKINIKNLGKLVAKFILLGAIAAPILAGLALSFFVLGPIITGVGVSITLLGSIFIGFGVIVSSTGTLIGGVLTLMTGPIGIAIAAIIGLGIAAFIFRDKLKSAFMSSLNFVKNVFVAAMNSNMILLIPGIGFVIRAIGLISENWELVKEFSSLAIDFMSRKMTSFFEFFSSETTDTINTTTSAWTGFLEFFTNMSEDLLKIPFFGAIITRTKETIEEIISLVGKGFDKLKSMTLRFSGINLLGTDKTDETDETDSFFASALKKSIAFFKKDAAQAKKEVEKSAAKSVVTIDKGLTSSGQAFIDNLLQFPIQQAAKEIKSIEIPIEDKTVKALIDPESTVKIEDKSIMAIVDPKNKVQIESKSIKNLALVKSVISKDNKVEAKIPPKSMEKLESVIDKLPKQKKSEVKIDESFRNAEVRKYEILNKEKLVQ